MFRTIWDWLEIDETCDKELIKKAYARQTKKYHPEDKPEEARLLREAYKKALSLTSDNADGKDTEKVIDGGYHYYFKGLDENSGERTASESDRFEYYQFDAQREERLKQLEKRISDLCYDAGHSDPGLWSEAVKNCLTVEDLQDTRAVAVVISILAQMSGMNDRVWDILEKELFRFYERSAEWKWLKSKFWTIRKENSFFEENNIVIVGQIDPKTGQIIPEKPEKPVLKSRAYTGFVIAVVIIDFVATLIMAYIFF